MSMNAVAVERVNRKFEEAEALQIMHWAAQAFAGQRLAVASSFGAEAMVVLKLLDDLGLRLPVIFIDTLHHFPETLAHVERVRRRYDLNLRVYRPAESREEFERFHGARLWERDLEAYQRLTRIEPMRSALADVDAWITGRRREQGPTRARLPILELGERVKVNPLVRWTHKDVWRFIHERGVPYNPLHDRGYASIGDAPLTTPIRPGEHERAGRWRGTGITECGIHSI